MSKRTNLGNKIEKSEVDDPKNEEISKPEYQLSLLELGMWKKWWYRPSILPNEKKSINADSQNSRIWSLPSKF